MSFSNKTALIINAHPDDSEMAMGGTLLLLRNKGIKIINASLTKGGAGTHSGKEIREKEFLAAQNKLNALPVLLNFEDTTLENNLETRLEVVKLIRTHKPDVVFAPYYRNDLANLDGIMHRDHSIAGALTSEAIKLARLKGVLPDLEPHQVKQLFFYMIPSGVHPQYLFDVSGVIDETIALIETYKSQTGPTEFVEVLKAMRRTHGNIARVKYAEAFVSDMPMLLGEGNILSLFD